MENGILKVPQPRALCYFRSMHGFEDDINNSLLRRYVDVVKEGGEYHIDKDMQARLQNLKQDKLPDAVGDCRIQKFEAVWQSSGLCPELNQDNEEYLTRFCDHFERDMKQVIGDALAEGRQTEQDKLLKEVLHHANFCLAKCSTFCGREEALSKVQSFFQDVSCSSKPLVIHGPSGCGKTSMVAMVAQQVKDWLNSEAVLIVRFLGTSPASSNIKTLLLSVIEQVCAVYDIDRPKVDSASTSLEVFRGFMSTIEECSQLCIEKPLILLLDSLDQLSAADGAHTLAWLPKDSIPENVYIIVSTLPEEYGILPLLKQRMDQPTNYLSLDQLQVETGLQMIETTMKRHMRTLTKEQHTVLTQLFEKCSRALYLKMLLDEALTWTSYSSVDKDMLSTTAEAVIQDLFAKMEQRYGQKLITCCFTYLTISNGGLTELELEDALSCNDEVLNEVFQYHNPPVPGVVRLPPLMWARIHHDIGEYLAERQTDNVTVITWYHRLFFAAARDRYLSPGQSSETASFMKQCHQDLADIFFPTNGIRRTVHLSKRGVTVDDADRHIAPQPLHSGNLRKLTKLPYFLYHSADFCDIADKLKSSIFCNLSWLLAKLKGTSFKDVFDDFRMVAEPDHEIEIMLGILQLASSILAHEPDRLPVEIASRLDHTIPQWPFLNNLVQGSLEVLRKQQDISLIPLFPCLPTPNGILRATLLGPTHLFPLIKQPLAIVWGVDTGLQVWNTQSFEIEHYLCDLPHSDGIHTSMCGKYVIHARNNSLVGWFVESGTLLFSVAILPESSSTSDTHVRSQRLPPLTCMSLSKTGALAAVRINYPKLLLDGKSLVVIDLENHCLVVSMVTSVCGDRLSNALFVDNDEKMVVARLHGTQGKPSVISIMETVSGVELKVIDLNHLKFTIAPGLLKACFLPNQVMVGLRPADFAIVDFMDGSPVYLPEKPSSTTDRLVDLHPLKSGCFLGLFFNIITKLTHLREMKSNGNINFDLVSSANQPKLLSVSESETLAFVGYSIVGTIDICDLENKIVLLELGAHSTGINSCVYDETSGQLFSSCLDGTLKVWRMSELLETKKKQHAIKMTTLDNAEDQTTQSDEKDTQAEQKQHVLLNHAAKGPSSNHVIQGGVDGNVELASTTDPKQGASEVEINTQLSSTGILSGDESPSKGRLGVTHMAVTTDGSRLVTCCDEDQPVIHDTETGKCIIHCETLQDSRK